MDPNNSQQKGEGIFSAGDAPAPAPNESPAVETNFEKSFKDDLVIAPAPEKKSKKGLVIFILIAILLIGGVCAAIFLLPKPGTKTSTKEFNDYFNYLISGEEKDSNVSEYISVYDTKIYELLRAGDYDEDYLEKAEDLEEKFWKNVSDDEKNNPDSLAVNLHKQFLTIKNLYYFDSLDDNYFDTLVKEKNTKSLVAEINSTVSSFPEEIQTEDAIVSAKNIKLKLVEYENEIVNLYTKSSCIKNGEVEQACAEKALSSSEGVSILEKISEVNGVLVDIKYQQISSVIESCNAYNPNLTKSETKE